MIIWLHVVSGLAQNWKNSWFGQKWDSKASKLAFPWFFSESLIHHLVFSKCRQKSKKPLSNKVLFLFQVHYVQVWNLGDCLIAYFFCVDFGQNRQKKANLEISACIGTYTVKRTVFTFLHFKFVSRLTLRKICLDIEFFVC